MSNPVRNLDDFELRHLPAHLEEAGRLDDLHRLLALDFVAGAEAPAPDPGGGSGRLWAAVRSWRQRPARAATGRRANAWYEAKVAADRLEEYVTDVRRAWQLAEQASRAAIQADGRSAVLGAELRYAGIVGSLTAMGAALPAPLLAALVEHGVWSAEHALAHARRPGADGQMQWSQPGDAAELLRRVAQASHVPLAVESAKSLHDPVLRAGAIGAVASAAGAQRGRLLSEALAVARSIDDDERRVQAVQALAPNLDEDTVGAGAGLLAPASDDLEVGWAVSRLARRMAQVGRGALAVELVLSPWSLDAAGEAQVGRVVVCRAVEELAEHLAVAQVRTLVDRLADPALADARAEVLAALAPYLPTDRVEDARALASTITNEFARARVLPLLVDGDPPTLRERALEAAAGQDREHRWRVLSCIAARQHGELRERLLKDAADAAIHSKYAESRAENLVAVLERCGPRLRSQLAEEARKRCGRIVDAFRRSHALEDLALLVDEPARSRVLIDAQRAAAKSGNVERQAVIAGLLGRDAVLELLAGLQTVGDDDDRARVALRAWLAPDVETLLAAGAIDFGHSPGQSVVDRAAEGVVAHGLAGDALAAITTGRRLGQLAGALTALVRHVPAELLDVAAKVVARVRPDYLRADPHAALAAALVDVGRPDEGYRVCMELVQARPSGGMQYVSARAVTEVAPLLAAQGRLDLAMALRAATTDVEAQILAGAGIADHAEPQEASRLLAAALARVQEGDNRAFMGYRQTELAGPLVRHGLLDEALRIAYASSAPVRVLARISQHAAEPRRSEIFADARRRASADFDGPLTRSTFITNLGFLVDVAPDEQYAVVLAELLAQIDAATQGGVTDYSINPTPLETELAFLGQHLAARNATVGYEVWRRALHEASGHGRDRVLGTLPKLAPLCAALATPQAGREIVAAIDEVCAWWP